MRDRQLCPLGNFKRILLCIIVFVSAHLQSIAQTVDFTTDKWGDCAPFPVQFRNLSTNSASDPSLQPESFTWTLGSAGTSTAWNPARIFDLPGTYDITLTVKYPGKSAISTTHQLVVYKKPDVKFTTSAIKGCTPLAIDFTDQSAAGDGTISKIIWDFADGTSAEGANATHTYTRGGSFSVSSIVTNSYGCKSGSSQSTIITTQEAPVASFKSDVRGSCQTPLTVNFTNTTTSNSNAALNYTWDFGDGKTSTEVNPSHTYTAEGSFTVSLTATTSDGCSHTVSEKAFIEIQQKMQADFSVTPVACAGRELTFTNTSTPNAQQTLWEFPDGTTATNAVAVKTFPLAGTYTVKLTSSGDGCQASTTKTIVVNELPKVDFSATPPAGCSTPFKTTFTSNAPNTVAWRWAFGDGTSGTAQHPAKTYTQEGDFDVKLWAATATGCADSITRRKYIQVHTPEVTIQTSGSGGCIPYDVTFTPVVTASEAVASYAWNLGDGTTANVQQPKHQYTKEGNFTVTLEITTTSGCKRTATTTVSAGKIPVVDFSATPLKDCRSVPVKFTNKSTPPGTSWTWDFPQDNNATETDENPSHTFDRLGVHDVILTVDNYGCVRSERKNAMIEILPPRAAFTITGNICVDRYIRQFNDRSDFGASATKKWHWDFGDGTTSDLPSPSHTFAAPGLYNVTLTIDNGSCTSVRGAEVLVIDEKPVLKLDQDKACMGNTVKASIVPGNYNNLRVYRINWGDGVTDYIVPDKSNPDVRWSHIYTQAGTYAAALEVQDKNLCWISSPTVSIDVHGVKAAFAFEGRNCEGDEITFKDQSTASSGTSITSWVWNFGDGTSPVTFTTPTPSLVHAFNDMKVFPVALTVQDANGCASTIKRNVPIAVVKAAFGAPTDVFCLNTSYTFSNFSVTAPLTYAWDFGDGTTSSQAEPQKQYTQPGTYDVQLTVTNPVGCKAVSKMAGYIKVPDPKAAFTAPTPGESCPPVNLKFTNTSTGYDKVLWDLGDGSSSTDVDASHNYIRPGTYNVVLEVTGLGGCKSTSQPTAITIKGPDGRITAGPATGCVPMAGVLQSQGVTDAVKYIWDFGDGEPFETTSTPIAPAHTYTKPGIFYPRLILEDADGCRVAALGDDKIIADKVTAAFTVDASQACDGGVVNFKDNSKSLTQDQLGLPMTYAWDFGIPGRNDDVSTSPNPSFTYDEVNTFQAKLITTSSYGCTNETTLPVLIEPKPLARIMPVSPLCEGASVQLTGKDDKNLPDTKWMWTVGTDKTYPVEVPPSFAFDQPGNTPVHLEIRNASGNCPSVADATIMVHPFPTLNASPKLTTICRGETLQLQANTAAGTTVTWTDYNISDIHSVSPKVNPLTDTVYRVLAESQFGCKREDEVHIQVSQPHQTTATGATICEGRNARLSASGATSYLWIPATGLDKPDVANPVASPVSTTTYQVVGYGTDKCFTDTALVTVTVNPSPVINAGPDIMAPVGSEIRIPAQGSPDITKLEWLPQTGLSCTDCLTPVVTPKTSVTYHVTATNQYGCFSMDEINIKMVCQSGAAFLPNTFTPNNDGQNDIFYIRGKGIQRVNVFRIYNRWGQLVFEKGNFNIEDPSFGWDGRFKGTLLNPDVFVYYAELVCDTNESFVLRGNVTLLK
ncbi:PKD domain-containing protein [Chitinophaga defluvii]|uniref:PKD domain-containing protein n=1 Tax=Chitinophaga defluvii TaxID=3163343 RepID=A0ABV2TE10_9BACT